AGARTTKKYSWYMNDFVLERFNGLTRAAQWLTGRDFLDQAVFVGGGSYLLWTVLACLEKRFWFAGMIALLFVSVLVESSENESIRKDAAAGLRNKRRADPSNMGSAWVWVLIT